MSNEDQRADISVLVGIISRSMPPDMPKPLKAITDASLSLLAGFLTNISIIAENHKPQVMLSEQPELSEAAVLQSFKDTIASYSEKELADLGLQIVKDELSGYEAIRGEPGLMDKPAPGTKPFKAPDAPLPPYLCDNPECNEKVGDNGRLCPTCFEAEQSRIELGSLKPYRTPANGA